ncbi:hypothetical protein D6829_01865 [Candidatus Pacearchaeota archaeon]|nr:MAG: hypothetical protein D6829_01865 [Candidatus Pacearchaeota archaeon]
MVSIIGFAGIVIKSFFEVDSSNFVEASLMIVVGTAFLIESKISKLRQIEKGLNSSNFTRLVTVILGIVAIISGIFSFPGIRFESSAFIAVKGILAIIAIVIIFIQTWIIKK